MLHNCIDKIDNIDIYVDLELKILTRHGVYLIQPKAVRTRKIDVFWFFVVIDGK